MEEQKKARRFMMAMQGEDSFGRNIQGNIYVSCEGKFDEEFTSLTRHQYAEEVLKSGIVVAPDRLVIFGCVELEA